MSLPRHGPVDDAGRDDASFARVARRPYLAPLIAVLLFFLGLYLAAPKKTEAASGQNGLPPGSSAITAIGYYYDQQETQPYTGALSTADTTTLSTGNLATFTLANKRRIAVLGRPNLPLSVRFQNAPPNQVAVTFVPLWVSAGTDHILGISDITTVSATNITDVDGHYIGVTTLSDAYGSNYGIWLLYAAPTAGGSCWFDPGSY